MDNMIICAYIPKLFLTNWGVIEYIFLIYKAAEPIMVHEILNIYIVAVFWILYSVLIKQLVSLAQKLSPKFSTNCIIWK
jgi:hypothetical protein